MQWQAQKVIVESKVSLSHDIIILLQMLWNALMALTPASKCALIHTEDLDAHATAVLH